MQNVDSFKKALLLMGEEYYAEAISELKLFLNSNPHENIRDGVLYNIALCYLLIKDIAEAKKYFNEIINTYPQATISLFESDTEEGLTAAKCRYGLVLCALLENKRDEALTLIEQMKADDFSGVKIDGNKITFYQLALQQLDAHTALQN